MMFSRPGHPFWRLLLNSIRGQQRRSDVIGSVHMMGVLHSVWDLFNNGSLAHRSIVPLPSAAAAADTPPVPPYNPTASRSRSPSGYTPDTCSPGVLHGGTRVAVPRLQQHGRGAAARVHLVPQTQQRDARAAGAHAELGPGNEYCEQNTLKVLDTRSGKPGLYCVLGNVRHSKSPFPIRILVLKCSDSSVNQQLRDASPDRPREALCIRQLLWETLCFHIFIPFSSIPTR